MAEVAPVQRPSSHFHPSHSRLPSPQEDVPEMEVAFKDLGKLTVNTGKELAWHCDAVSSPPRPLPSPHLTGPLISTHSLLSSFFLSLFLFRDIHPSFLFPVHPSWTQFVRKFTQNYPENHLYNVIGQSTVHKARLLHYFPVEDPGEATGEPVLDSWW